jgi:hypothetical protein
LDIVECLPKFVVTIVVVAEFRQPSFDVRAFEQVPALRTSSLGGSAQRKLVMATRTEHALEMGE